MLRFRSQFDQYYFSTEWAITPGRIFSGNQRSWRRRCSFPSELIHAHLIRYKAQLLWSSVDFVKGCWISHPSYKGLASTPLPSPWPAISLWTVCYQRIAEPSRDVSPENLGPDPEVDAMSNTAAAGSAPANTKLTEVSHGQTASFGKQH